MQQGMVAALLGLVFVVVFCAGLAAVMYGVHRAARPRQVSERQLSHALRELSPRGGRHRFNVRLFEVGFLSALWTVVGGLTVIWLPIAQAPQQRAAMAASALLVMVLLTTWWAWRRGVLRGTDVQRRHSPLLPTQRQARR